MENPRYVLWGDDIVLKSSDILDEVAEVYRFYVTHNNYAYEDLFIFDNKENKEVNI